MNYSHYMLIPLNHLEIQDIIDLNKRITIFPSNYIKNRNILCLSEKLKNFINYRNYIHYSNDFQAMKFLRSEDVDYEAFYKLPYAYVQFADKELQTHKSKLNFAECFYALLRILDCINYKYIEKERFWSEWERPYKYSAYCFVFTKNHKLEGLFELRLNKLCLDIDISTFNKRFIDYIELIIKNINNEKLINVVNLYNKIYGCIILKNFQDANILSISLLEYLFCDGADDAKSQKLVYELSKIFEIDLYYPDEIQKIITTSYRNRSKNVHKYKGLNMKSLYNFNLYYFNPIENLLENDEIDLFNLFLLVNHIMIYVLENECS